MSQMAQFQAKTEYGEDLAGKLEKVAVHTLKYKHFVPLMA